MSPVGQRIVIVGVTGSGKTWLAEHLAQKYNLPLAGLDNLFFVHNGNWKKVPADDFLAAVKKTTATDKWIICGNYSIAREIVWARADTLIWLDTPFFKTLGRLLFRTMARLIDQKPICNGNHETVLQVFGKESIILWFFKTFWKRRKNYGQAFAAPSARPHLRLIRLCSDKEIDAFLAS